MEFLMLQLWEYKMTWLTRIMHLLSYQSSEFFVLLKFQMYQHKIMIMAKAIKNQMF